MTAFYDALARTADRTPNRVAVVDGERRLSYSELRTAVDGAAAGLRARGVGPGDVITSQLRNGIEAVTLCLAANAINAVHNPVTMSSRERELDFIQRQAATAVFVDDADDELFQHPAAARPRLLPRDEPTFLVYTSGSTADSKGVLHSDRTLGDECTAQAAYHELRDDEVFVIPSSLAHVSGLIYGVLLPVWLGATVVLMDEWDPGRFLELVAAEHGTFSAGATPFLQGITDHPLLERFDTSSFRVFPCGGADVPPDLIRRAAQRLAIRTGRGYGSTEFPSITSGAGPGEDDNKRADTDGRPIGANEVRIVDAEIEARGRELFVGYRDAQLDRDAFTDDGWFRTGDLGVVDDDGYLTVTGRLKDVIIRSGEKISARELEVALAGHPAVDAVAVIAVPDPRTAERACACVVPRPNATVTVEELGRFLLAAGFSKRKLPEQVALLDALPTTAAGKIDKHALRARLRAISTQ